MKQILNKLRYSLFSRWYLSNKDQILLYSFLFLFVISIVGAITSLNNVFSYLVAFSLIEIGTISIINLIIFFYEIFYMAKHYIDLLKED